MRGLAFRYQVDGHSRRGPEPAEDGAGADVEGRDRHADIRLRRPGKRKACANRQDEYERAHSSCTSRRASEVLTSRSTSSLGRLNSTSSPAGGVRRVAENSASAATDSPTPCASDRWLHGRRQAVRSAPERLQVRAADGRDDCSADDRLAGAGEWVGRDGVSDDAAGAELDDSRLLLRAEERDEGARPDHGDAADRAAAEELNDGA